MAKKKVEEKINLDSILFKCRDILRQARNSGSFFEKRDMMLTLVFLRFIGEKFEDGIQKLRKELIAQGLDPDDEEIFAAFFDDATFTDGTYNLPVEARWSTIINTPAPQLNVALDALLRIFQEKYPDIDMSLLQRLFQKKNTKQPQAAQAEELVSLRALDSFMTLLLEGDHFVAKSEYKDKLATYSDLVHWFDVLQSSGTMDDYCRKNAASQPEITAILNRYKSFQELIDAQNERYITSKMQTEKSYLDCILKDCDPNILLDDDQRRVVLTDEDYCLVVAGAGAGKTTTVAAKVKYLVDKQGVDPSQILVISFTNKAVNELKQRIIGELHIECPIATFHSTGNAIIHKHNPDKLNIVDDGKLYYVVQDYFRNNVLKNESAVNSLILFFASYFDAPYEGKDLNAFFNHIAKSNFTTMRSELDEFKQQVIDTRTKKTVTIQSEIMRSAQEVEIANFLYLNGIDYEYEPALSNIAGQKPY